MTYKTKTPNSPPSNNIDEQNLYSDHMPVIATVIINIKPGISALQKYENNIIIFKKTT